MEFYPPLVLVAICMFVVARANMEVGFGHVSGDTIAGETVLVEGQVPTWIEGSFYRLSCGSFGETGSNLNIENKVSHLFDCFAVGQSYRFQDGTVTFYQRYFDSASTNIWRAYDMNMNESRVFWVPVYSSFDYERQQIIQPIMDYTGIIERMPEVTLWQLGDKVFSHSEYEGIVQLDPHDGTHKVHFHEFDDNHFGYTDEIIIDEDAHEVQEADGTLYCTHMVYKINFETFTVHQWKNVFKIQDNARSSVSRIPYPDIELSACFVDGSPIKYPVLGHRQGYMHSITMTENYIILPESSYLTELCSLFVNTRRDEALYAQFFTWEEDAPSRIWVIRKSDGAIMANLTTEPVFATHQFNAYEENGFIYADMVTHNDSQPYENDTFVEELIRRGVEDHDVHRYIIDMSDWTLRRVNLLPGVKSLEFPNINQAYLGQPYTFAWAGLGVYSAAPNSVAKINVQKGEIEARYDLGEGFYAFEPWFVPTPTSSAEDDGVIMVQGLDSHQEKGFLMIFDARDLSVICRVTGTDLVLYGLHNKFYPAHIGSISDPDDISTILPIDKPTPSKATKGTITFSLIFVIVGVLKCLI